MERTLTVNDWFEARDYLDATGQTETGTLIDTTINEAPRYLTGDELLTIALPGDLVAAVDAMIEQLHAAYA